MSKRYDQYCPVAHALGLVGERWALLIVRELLHGPQRYTDLTANLPKIGTNILSSRLKDLEACGIVAKRRLPPPAASQVYELTRVRPGAEAGDPRARDLGHPLARAAVARRRACTALARARARDGASHRSRRRARSSSASATRSPRSSTARRGRAARRRRRHRAAPDPAAFYHLFVERRWDEIEVEGDRELLERLLDAASAPAARRRPCRPPRSGYAPAMCRNIRTLHNFEPSATEEEIRDAALQYVRKVSGMQKPSRANAEAFERAVDDVTAATARLLDELVTTAPPQRPRGRGRERRRARSAERFGRAA